MSEKQEPNGLFDAPNINHFNNTPSTEATSRFGNSLKPLAAHSSFPNPRKPSSRRAKTGMVRIQQRTVAKPYMRGKRVYRYDRRNVTITRKFHSVSDAFLKQELTETVTVHDGSLVIVLTPKKK